MPSSSLTGLFPVYSPPNTEGRRTTFLLALCGEDDNMRVATLWINNLSGMQMKAIEDHVCYVSGSLIIYNEGPEANDAPHFLLEASTVEDLGVLAETMTPSSQNLANGHFIGQVIPISDGEGREFAINTGAYSSRDEGQRTFEIRLHFDDNNRRFDNFRMPRVGGNVEVQAKWIRDTSNPHRSHWLVEHVTFLGALANTAPAGPSSPTSPIRRRLFGAPKTASTSKRCMSSSPEGPNKKIKQEPVEAVSHLTQHSQHMKEIDEKEESNLQPVSTTSSATLPEEEEENEQAGDVKGKGKAKGRGKK
ncbi:hypothetical protein JOM56_002627 [Amanita muscaria]